MILERIALPSLDDVALASATLTYIEATSISANEQLALVKVRYFDDLEPGTQYTTYYVYDVQAQTYTSVNSMLSASLSGQAADYELFDAVLVGNSDDWQLFVDAGLKASDESDLILINNGTVADSNLLLSEFGIDAQIDIERIETSADGRFVALQTSSALLADELSPDINDSSDIYLLDRVTGQITRVSFVGGAEVYEDTYLADLMYTGGELRIAFVTDAAYVSPTIDNNSTEVSDQQGSKTDAYVWSAAVTAAGVDLDSVSFRLASESTDGAASGFVSFDPTAENSQVRLTTTGVVFSSSAGGLVSNDQNGSEDVFFSSEQGSVSRLSVLGGEEISLGGRFLDTDDYGQAIYYTTEANELGGSTDSPVLVQFNAVSGETSIVDLNSDPNALPLSLTSSDDGSLIFSSVYDPTALSLDQQVSLNSAENSDLGICGTVYEWATHTLLDGVTASVLDSTGGLVISGEESTSAGEYSIAARLSADQTLGYSRLLSAEETGRAISAADALATLKLAVGLNPNSNDTHISAYQYLAADVNQDGRVSAADALSVLKMAVNLAGAPEREWLFVNEQADFWDETANNGAGGYLIGRNSVDWAIVKESAALANSAGQVNQVAVLKGDVNASWETSSSNSTLSDSYFEALETAGIGPAEQWWLI
ncbi:MULTISPECIES: hypothetical protein [unclassified Marinobacterium]|uniref:hypothetical protein n=1 Tax=unclassified Marinobacterium TaxID=2644139 RepID=UPI001569BAC0|nr:MULTISPECIES: hypothetical protein [unclassified Marinobacterium]NRP56741.1 hypothetical protein [Marinobacterium sp. xm-d-510]NRP96470.1 hypothetical protein [Marinobacterium sp. xm-a-127]